MPHFTNSELISFNEDLNRYQAKEVAADKRDNWVESRVNDSMKEGGECYPFTSEHVTEALSEMCFADQAMLASYTKMCYDNHCNLDTPVHLADFVVDRVNDYWYKIAEFIAQEQYDKAGF